MKVLGIDFTSRPRRSKPLTCIEAALVGDLLRVEALKEWPNFESFESVFMEPGPWIAGIDFPFGQSRRFIENIGWPTSWPEYVGHVATMERPAFRKALDDYRKNRPAGDREHRRATDVAAGSISPQKLYGVPVGLMFFEGAPRLQRVGVHIPRLQNGDPQRVVVEAYPGTLARSLIQRRSYKQDTRAKQTADQLQARRDILNAILDGGLRESYGLTVEAPPDLADDPGGDHLDALLCAIQAAWAWTKRDAQFGAPREVDVVEGWIADPSVLASMNAA